MICNFAVYCLIAFSMSVRHYWVKHKSMTSFSFFSTTLVLFVQVGDPAAWVDRHLLDDFPHGLLCSGLLYPHIPCARTGEVRKTAG